MQVCEFLKKHNILFDKEPNILGAKFDCLNKKKAAKAFELIQNEEQLKRFHFELEKTTIIVTY